MSHNLELIKELISSLQDEVETLETEVVEFSDEPIDLSKKVRKYEADLIKAALAKTGGNQRRAAQLLNIKPTTLNLKIKQLEIQFLRLRTAAAPLRALSKQAA